MKIKTLKNYLNNRKVYVQEIQNDIELDTHDVSVLVDDFLFRAHMHNRKFQLPKIENFESAPKAVDQKLRNVLIAWNKEQVK